jgi:hypothetical protein
MANSGWEEDSERIQLFSELAGPGVLKQRERERERERPKAKGGPRRDGESSFNSVLIVLI